jgi:hypothetical protein
MPKLITDFNEIYQCQQRAKALFNLDLFNPEHALFPQQVFFKQFGHYLFLDFNDWFNETDDYEKLQGFCRAVKEPLPFGT